ncbi:tetratricopeptide repeat protein [Pseudomonas sp. UFMG81]|uniref:tetratricopeptide repeat protein n=1 Tax=Pseudomonas sp. UFMG81 TaxID=2745936 RepID=UPI00188E760F|nr:SEL1-like repeat protein [Pseudomonas sp. UFMG81]
MIRHLALIALMAALGGCQSMENLGQSTAQYIKAARNPPPRTPMEAFLAELRNPYVALGTFDYSLGDDQAKACYRATYSRTAQPGQVRQVMAASEQGHGACQHVLGTLYETGSGVSLDLVRARALYVQAAPNDPYAYIELGRMARDGVGEPVDFVRARDFYKQAGPGGAVGLGGLMEQGKGGPQDVQGALNLYMQATRKHRDPAWKAMRTLQAKGLPLDAGQVEKYNRLWLEGFMNIQRVQIKSMRSFSGISPAETMTVKVLYRFTAGQTRPTAYLAQSSGDPQVDGVVVRGLDKLPMEDPYLVPEGKSTPDFVAPVVIHPSAFGG